MLSLILLSSSAAPTRFPPPAAFCNWGMIMWDRNNLLTRSNKLVVPATKTKLWYICFLNPVLIIRKDEHYIRNSKLPTN